ncbi:MAG: hypothetical protein N3C12_13830 [Candidatus Binatia bacterium]|nr:hypothetical protein [Candidatus Binatia bacterium]
MGKSRVSRWGWAAFAACFVCCVIAGCGSDGSSGVTVLPSGPPNEPIITGFVLAPNGVMARDDGVPPRQFAFDRLLAAPAQALQGISAVGVGVPVSLVELDWIDFADGRIDSPVPLDLDTVTEADGRYRIMDPEARDVLSCRKMLMAGSGGTVLRALVYGREVNVDPASEALVRVLLDFVSGSTAQLCDFSAAELQRLQQRVYEVTWIASGNSVAEITAAAHDLARRNRSLQQALVAAATTE